MPWTYFNSIPNNIIAGAHNQWLVARLRRNDCSLRTLSLDFDPYSCQGDYYQDEILFPALEEIGQTTLSLEMMDVDYAHTMTAM